MKQSVLVVDDEPNILEGYRRVLRPLRDAYAIEFFASSSEAVERLKSKRFDLVFTDLRMPQIDGMEIIRKVNALHPACPVIVITGYGDVSTAVEAMKLGAVDYLQKPVAADALLNRISAILSPHNPTRPAAAASGLADQIPRGLLFCGQCGAKAEPPSGAEALSVFACPSCGAAIAVPLLIGDLMLEHDLGAEGPFASYAGYDLTKDTYCHIYALENAPPQDARELLTRSREVADMLTVLSHANIIPLSKCEIIDGTLYAVEPAPKGNLLAQYDFVSEPADVDACLEVLLQVAIALSVAHHREIPHHGICPQAICVDSAGKAWLGKFFISHILYLYEYGRGLKPSASPHYLSPERIATGFESKPGDVFSLAVLAYRMLSGAYPFDGANEIEIIHSRIEKKKTPWFPTDKPSTLVPEAVAYRPPSELHARRGEVPLHLSELIMAALSPHPDNRPRLSTLLDAILRIQAERNQQAEVYSATRRMLEKASTIPLRQP